MNVRETNEHSLTVVLPKFVLVGRDRSRHGPYDTLEEAAWWASSLWPGDVQDDTLEDGWDVELVR